MKLLLLLVGSLFITQATFADTAEDSLKSIQNNQKNVDQPRMIASEASLRNCTSLGFWLGRENVSIMGHAGLLSSLKYKVNNYTGAEKANASKELAVETKEYKKRIVGYNETRQLLMSRCDVTEKDLGAPL